MNEKALRPQTRAIRTRAGQTAQREHTTPVYLTSSFEYEDAEQMRAAFADEIPAYIYSRFSNPNTDELAARMCALEGAEAGYATASGMSAIFGSIMGLMKSGDHLLSSNAIFGSTHTVITKFLPRWGITHTYFDIRHPEKIRDLIRPQTKMIFLETPSNPGLAIVDLAAVAEEAHRHGIILHVDNCFATPIVQTPILLGADLVTHSATKWIDGQGRVLGGIVLGKKELVHEIYLFCRSTGPSLSPFNAWMLSKSLETLEVRMQRHCQTAMNLAEALVGSPHLQEVRYPFLPSHPQYGIAKKQMKAGGGLFCFEVKGGLARGRKFLDALELLSLTANLGDTRTIASHPASTTHAKLTEEERLDVGITPGLIRISAGLEASEDILSDILQALEKSA